MDTRLSVMLQKPHNILSHRIDRVHALLCDSKLRVWKWIIFAYHSCMILFFFDGQVFASWKALLIFSDLQEIVLSPGNAEHHTTPPSDCSGHGSVYFSQVHHKGPTLYSQTPKLQLTHWCSRYSEYARGDPNQEVSLYWILSLVIRILVWSKTILKICLTLYFCLPSFF